MNNADALPGSPRLPRVSAAASPGASDPAGGAATGLVEALRSEAIRVGFSRLGVAPAVSPPYQEALRRWLASGMAGVMTDWMTRHALLREDPATVLPGVRSIVMLATDHARGRSVTAEEIKPGQGRVARYARGDDYHDLLRERLNSLAGWLRQRIPGSQARGVVDSAPLAERDYGRLAGLGWFGKNTMLIDPGAGSYFLLSALLTTVELPVDMPIATDHCGSCTACLDACPTGAFPAPRLLDATRCISALTIEDHRGVATDLRIGMGDWIFGCDICQEVCPWNRHAPGSDEPAFQPRSGAESLELIAVLGLDEAGFRRRFRGSPILRAKRRGLLRSAAIALGNSPDPAALPALARAAEDSEPVIRGAAVWALGRWLATGIAAADVRAILAARVGAEEDPAVRAEIDEAIRGQVSSMSAEGSRPGPSAP